MFSEARLYLERPGLAPAHWKIRDHRRHPRRLRLRGGPGAWGAHGAHHPRHPPVAHSRGSQASGVEQRAGCEATRRGPLCCVQGCLQIIRRATSSGNPCTRGYRIVEGHLCAGLLTGSARHLLMCGRCCQGACVPIAVLRVSRRLLHWRRTVGDRAVLRRRRARPVRRQDHLWTFGRNVLFSTRIKARRASALINPVTNPTEA